MAAHMMATSSNKSRLIATALRLFFAVAVVIGLIAVAANRSRAAEASSLAINLPLADAPRTADVLKLQRILQKEGFVLNADARRKGQMVIVTGVQRSRPWRLVIDAQSGEIVGRRPLGPFGPLDPLAEFMRAE
jgi:hypothetical protein